MNKESFNWVHYAPEDLGGGGGDLDLEGVFETQEEEEIFFLEGDPNIPVVEEQVPEESPEMKALREQNTLFMQQISGLQQQADSTAALTKGLENLGQNLRPQVQQSQTPYVDPAEAKKEFNDKFYEDPSTNLDKFALEKIQPALQQMMQINIQNAKQFLLLDPERGSTYKKHTEEVDKVFNQMSTQKQLQDANAYKEATDIVASRHLPETMAEMKEKMKAEIIAEMKGEASVQGNGQPAQHSEAGVTKRSNQTPRTSVLPARVWEYAGQMGFQGRGETADKARVYQSWKEGKLPNCGVDFK